MSTGELYRMYDAHGVLLYLGQTTRTTIERAAGHVRSHWWEDVTTIKVERWPLAELSARERDAIAAECPLYNRTSGPTAPEARRVRQDRSALAVHERLSKLEAGHRIAAAAPPALSPTDAATYLGVTRQTVHNLMKRGELRRFKVGRLTRIPLADVEAMIGGPRSERDLVDGGAG